MGEEKEKRRVADLDFVNRQAFLSGCVVATDIPTDQDEELKQFVIEVSSSKLLLSPLPID